MIPHHDPRLAREATAFGMSGANARNDQARLLTSLWLSLSLPSGLQRSLIEGSFRLIMNMASLPEHG